MSNSIRRILDKISQLMVAQLGFSADAAMRQLREVEKIIFAAIVKRLLREEKKERSIQNAADIETFLSSYTDEKKLAKVIEEESTRVLSDYFSTITTMLSIADKKYFFNSLQMIVAEKK